MKLLVCGGRNFKDSTAVFNELDRLAPELVIQGGAAGADKIARAWAQFHNVPIWTFPADWEKYGPKAGPIRNAMMLAQSRPDAVLAFPGGRGTADTVRRAHAAGIMVMEVK
jgi:hypothetical protein